MKFFQKLVSWIRGLFAERPCRVEFIEGDELPAHFATRNLYVAREDGELWSAGLTCPCRCGRRLEVMLLKDVKPRWDLSVDKDGLPSLHPSVWVADGCRSHFWLRHGKIHWC
jgi:hypothetical protein